MFLCRSLFRMRFSLQFYPRQYFQRRPRSCGSQTMAIDGDADEPTSVGNGNAKLRGRKFWDAIGAPKFVAAPMVDQSELAYRVLCRRYGTQLAFTPMFHSRLFAEDAKYRDKQIADNFAAKDSPEEARPLFVQFCGNVPTTLSRAALQLPHGRYDAVDINCGCPQGIAKKGHYGAFLLSEKDLLVEIVRHLDQVLSVPVTLKMRLVTEDLQDTLNLASALEAAGVSVLTLHGRTKEKKGQMTGTCDWDSIAAVRKRVGVPLIANGGVETYEDAMRCLEMTGCDAVMSSEAILETPSLFALGMPASTRPVLPVPQDTLAAEYLELAGLYKTSHRCVKTHLFKFLYAGLQQHTDLRSQLGNSKGLNEISVVAAALKARRSEARAAVAQTGSSSDVWPDAGWYLRYRRPLGGDKRKRKVAADAKEGADEKRPNVDA